MSADNAQLLNTANKGIVWVFYAAYVGLLVWACVADVWKVLPLVGVPAVGFALVSVVRARVNAPRPYENGGPAPRIERDGEGKSFPSRHAFSAFAIATCWFAACAPVAAVLLVAAVALAALRVAGGVHFPRDVVAGAVCGIAVGALTVWLAGLF